MRLGVLDVGSNTVHLLVVDAHRGAHPTPMSSMKSVLCLTDQLRGGRLSRTGAEALIRTVDSAKQKAVELGCADLLAFATSAIRDADNSLDVLARIRQQTGVQLQVLSGEQEANYTFLAVRRWFGWSAGRLLVIDIGGGSLEMATGMDEAPELAVSLPLGAGRLRRDRLSDGTPSQAKIAELARWLDVQLAAPVRRLRKTGPPDKAVATSKTFRSLARLSGAAPSSSGPRVRRTLTDAGLRQVIAFISRMSADDIAELEGVSANRAHQLLAGAVLAEATMRAFELTELDLCPWALREGVILRRLDTELETAGPVAGNGDLRAETGRKITDGAR
jgi:exopolyphosphatase / guanosine-5'-triphosphate,3'-diphosphate pyrophosphatase